MFFHDKRLQYEVKVDTPNPQFAKYLQQAIGGIEGEIRVAMQYMFQAMGARGPVKYRDMLMETATEELSHIEMLGHAVALNLEGAPVSEKEAAAKDPVVNAILGGMNPRHVLSSGLSAMPVDASGVPFDMSHIYASGNIAADMYANVTAEATGRTLAVRLYNMTDDKGMRDMLSFLIARDTMHQQQWMMAIEDMGGIQETSPIPNSFPQSMEKEDYSYVFLGTDHNGEEPPQGKWTSGPTVDGRSTFSSKVAVPEGQVPSLGAARPDSGAQSGQIEMPEAAE